MEEPDSKSELLSLENPDWTAKRQWWYEQAFILLEIVKLLKNREVCFLEKLPRELLGQRRSRVIRCLHGYNLGTIQMNFDAFRFLKFPYLNLYHSLAYFQNMPVFSFNPKQRSVEYKAWTDGGYEKVWAGYDLGIDIDSINIGEAHETACKIKALFDEFQVVYHCKFSGAKGFHFVIPYLYLPQLPREKIVPMLSKFVTMMKEIENFQEIDDSIIDDRRIFKVPYSWDRGKICLPLTDDQLYNFNLEMVRPENIINSKSPYFCKIRDRGLLLRHEDVGVEQARENFIKLAGNFIEVDKWLSIM